MADVEPSPFSKTSGERSGGSPTNSLLNRISPKAEYQHVSLSVDTRVAFQMTLEQT